MRTSFIRLQVLVGILGFIAIDALSQDAVLYQFVRRRSDRTFTGAEKWIDLSGSGKVFQKNYKRPIENANEKIPEKKEELLHTQSWIYFPYKNGQYIALDPANQNDWSFTLVNDQRCIKEIEAALANFFPEAWYLSQQKYLSDKMVQYLNKTPNSFRVFQLRKIISNINEMNQPELWKDKVAIVDEAGKWRAEVTFENGFIRSMALIYGGVLHYTVENTLVKSFPTEVSEIENRLRGTDAEYRESSGESIVVNGQLVSLLNQVGSIPAGSSIISVESRSGLTATNRTAIVALLSNQGQIKSVKFRFGGTERVVNF